MMDSVVEGAREMASSLQRLERRASVSSISPGRDLKDDNHRSKVAYMLILTLISSFWQPKQTYQPTWSFTGPTKKRKLSVSFLLIVAHLRLPVFSLFTPSLSLCLSLSPTAFPSPYTLFSDAAEKQSTSENRRVSHGCNIRKDSLPWPVNYKYTPCDGIQSIISAESKNIQH